MANLTRASLGKNFKFPMQDRLRELLDYDPETGLLSWKKMRKGVPYDGAPAGCLTNDGYLKVSVDGTQFKAHHVIWCWVTGEWPDRIIDHVDTNGLNNRFLNLRKATHGQNVWNSTNKKTPSSPSPLKGAYFDPRRGLWHSRIIASGELKFLGYFGSAEEAHEAYSDAAKVLHGEFARTT